MKYATDDFQHKRDGVSQISNVRILIGECFCRAVFHADLPKSLRKFELALGSKERSGILHVSNGIERVTTGSQKRLEVVLGNLVVCPILIHHALPAVDHAARAVFNGR